LLELGRKVPLETRKDVIAFRSSLYVRDSVLDVALLHGMLDILTVRDWINIQIRDIRRARDDQSKMSCAKERDHNMSHGPAFM